MERRSIELTVRAGPHASPAETLRAMTSAARALGLDIYLSPAARSDAICVVTHGAAEHQRVFDLYLSRVPELQRASALAA
jgi:hypothetical protein